MRIIERRKIYYVISIVLIVLSLASLFTKGLNLGIDFKGGSLLSVSISQAPEAQAVREALQPIGKESINLQISEGQYMMRTFELSQEETQEILGALTAAFGEVTFLSAETVGPAIGKELTRKAIIALLLALVLMMVYIAIRFEWRFGLSAFITQFHDAFIVVGIFSLFQWEINTPFIAALLTVVGYSINDTIVIFDRIRENLKNSRKEDYGEIVNRSVTQSFNRSINTLLTCLFPLVALLIWGGATLKVLVLGMLIGFIVGGYSSIFVSSPLWYEIRTRAK